MSLRLALFYAAAFLNLGIQMPFWPVWLAAQGMGPREIGVLLAATNATRIFAAPAIAPFADRFGRRKPIVVAACAGGLAATVLFTTVQGFWALLAVTVLVATFQTTVMPLAESLTVLAARARAIDYGRVRLWGSLAFIVAATATGRWLIDDDASIVLWLVIGALALTFAASLALPDLRTPRATHTRASLALLTDRPFLLFLLAATLLQSSHAVYYGFSTLHWREVGLSDSVIGALWSEGVVAEIVLFALSSRIRMGPHHLLLVAAACGIVRWGALGATDALWALAIAQALHAFTFGAAHLAAMRFIMGGVPEGATTTAQTLYYTLTGGIGLAVFMPTAGLLYAGWGAGAYYAMAAMSLVGGIGVLIARRLGGRSIPSPARVGGEKE